MPLLFSASSLKCGIGNYLNNNNNNNHNNIFFSKNTSSLFGKLFPFSSALNSASFRKKNRFFSISEQMRLTIVKSAPQKNLTNLFDFSRLGMLSTPPSLALLKNSRFKQPNPAALFVHQSSKR